jgi:hypothetical protein
MNEIERAMKLIERHLNGGSNHDLVEAMTELYSFLEQQRERSNEENRNTGTKL